MITLKIKKPEGFDGESQVHDFPVINLVARKSVDGNVLIFDHPYIDIIISTSKNKIVSFPKDSVEEDVYNSQMKMLEFMKNKGVIVYDSIQAGNVYGALEASIPENADYADPIEAALYTIGRFIEKEKPAMEYVSKYKKDLKRDLIDPSAEHSTELGEVPHADAKGDLDPRKINYGSPWRAY
jgi:hypothetical protein